MLRHFKNTFDELKLIDLSQFIQFIVILQKICLLQYNENIIKRIKMIVASFFPFNHILYKSLEGTFTIRTVNILNFC